MKKFVVLIVLVLLVVGGWSAGWLWAAGEVRSQVAALDTAASPQVTCGRLDVVGFPFRFDVACTDARIVDGDVTATVAGLKASMLVYNPTQVVFSALSPATFDDAYSGARSRLEFSGAEGSARLVTDDTVKGLTGEGWRIGRISVVADDIRWSDTLIGDTLALSADHAEAHVMDVPERHDAAKGTAVLAAYASLANASAPSLQVTGGETSFEAELTGVPDDVRQYGDADMLCRLRDANGELKLVALKGSAGTDYLESTGTFTLDPTGKPDGQLQLRSHGIVERIRTLVPPELQFVFGQQAADGSYGQTLNFKAGIVMAGLLPMPFMFESLCAR